VCIYNLPILSYNRDLSVCEYVSLTTQNALWYLRFTWPEWGCATSRTVPESIPDVVTGFFNDILSSDRTTTLGSTQPLVKMSTRNFLLGVKAAGALGWQPHHLHVPYVTKSGSLNLLEPSGSRWTCYETLYLYLTWPECHNCDTGAWRRVLCYIIINISEGYSASPIQEEHGNKIFQFYVSNLYWDTLRNANFIICEMFMIIEDLNFWVI
jgi:hypothetical protein